MKLNSFNECGCGAIIEPNEFWCDDCHTFDMAEAEDTDIFLDELFLEKQLNEDGELSVEGVVLVRKY